MNCCMQNYIKIYVTGMIFCFLLSACGFRERSFDTLHLRLNKDVTTLDPAYIVDVDGGRLAAYLYNGLVRLDYDLNIIPDIAMRWDISDDATRYRFYLRDDVSFTDGQKLTAHHVKTAFERLLDPKLASPRSWIFEKVRGAEEMIQGKSDSATGFVVVDDHTFDIILSEPFSPFLSVLTTTNALIALPYNDEYVAYCIGTGPFEIKLWERGNKMRFERNESYFDIKPKLSAILIRVIPEDFTAITEFENGKIDILEIPRAEFEYFTEKSGFKQYVHSAAILNTYYIGFNCQQYPYSLAQFRRTISYAVNRQLIADKFLDSRVQLADSPVPPALLGTEIKVYPKQEYDTEKAKVLFSQLQRDWDTPLKLYIRSGDRETEGVAELIQHDLAKIGMDIQIEGLEWTTFKEKTDVGEVGMFILSWWADYPDIENFLFPLFHSSNLGGAGNRVRYVNDRFDRLIEQAKSTIDKDNQNKLYEQALHIIMTDQPWVCLWHKKHFTVTQPWVRNYRQPSVHTTVEKGIDIFIEKGE